jgi:nucleotide-binding universal stress UspA family protein
MFKKILVCLDGSGFAEHILPYAIEQAQKFDSKIVLLRVIPAFPTIGKIIGKPELTDEMQEAENLTNKESRAVDYVDKMVTYLEGKGLDTEGVIIKGTPDKAIGTYIGQYGVDLIALATHGHSGLGRVFSGSVAEYLLRESGIPMLAIRPKESEYPEITG